MARHHGARVMIKNPWRGPSMPWRLWGSCVTFWQRSVLGLLPHLLWSLSVSENKALCHPSSVDSLSTSAATEDHVSMGGWAARKALRVIEHVEQGKADPGRWASLGNWLSRSFSEWNNHRPLSQCFFETPLKYRVQVLWPFPETLGRSGGVWLKAF